MLFLPDNPMTCKRLGEKERVVAIARLQGDTTGVENKTFKAAQVWELLLDSRAWMMFIMNTAINIPNAAVSTFQAAIITRYYLTSHHLKRTNVNKFDKPWVFSNSGSPSQPSKWSSRHHWYLYCVVLGLPIPNSISRHIGPPGLWVLRHRSLNVFTRS